MAIAKSTNLKGLFTSNEQDEFKDSSSSNTDTSYDISISKFETSEDKYETLTIEQITLSKLTVEETYRDKIVNEFYETEMSYVTSMECCISGYITKLNDTKYVSYQEKMSQIFLHFNDVFYINSVLLDNMTRLKKSGTLSSKLGEALSLFIPMLNVYKLYVGNSDLSINTLIEMSKNKKFNDLLVLLREQLPPGKQLDLRSFLIMPVQRLPRYSLLLADLIKHTSKDHPDFENLLKAQIGIKKLANTVNEIVEERAKNQILVQLSKKIEGLEEELVSPFREFIRSGLLMKVCRKFNKERYFYLFNDMLIYGIGDEKYMKVSQVFPLETVQIKVSEVTQNAFEIRGTKSFTVITKTKEECDGWIHNIESAILKQKSRLKTLKREKGENETAPVWVQNTNQCQICSTKFSALSRQHHCRKCGSCVCSNCSPDTLVIKGKKERVCIYCKLEETKKTSLDILKVKEQSPPPKVPQKSPKLQVLMKENVKDTKIRFISHSANNSEGDKPHGFYGLTAPETTPGRTIKKYLSGENYKKRATYAPGEAIPIQIPKVRPLTSEYSNSLPSTPKEVVYTPSLTPRLVHGKPAPPRNKKLLQPE
ncbi:Rho/RAC guanine nucleotide exchange factor, putative [Entamoeba invadens IP1]|uniref:Rho/RAC guanine nucleotide exchange factor, putative n=1 Tax=Entamoeba invadens IP1 TaxID=370355 RepID=UPI0002C3EBB7|nr:Rho/RAC guanine nucleotide exchange factor, putative [Entamoeba invadens IP1]ELP90470.1 Rho/RAC guanine nucleotide exchange factor, putative [Entamoeba invadens IP1]|eukprot:XP_004257241.1 Rho/RAC guanine nucleotide exchange factor, putative [Entamoeba invadens IP1]